MCIFSVYLDGEEDGFKVAKFQNTKNDKYLRIHKNDVNIQGTGGAWTRFKVRPTSDNSFKFESCKLAGKYVAVQPRVCVISNIFHSIQFNPISSVHTDVKNHYHTS